MDTNSHASVGLPRWQSHKQVYGDRIKEIRTVGLDAEWLLDCGGLVPVTSDLIARGAPLVGDYYVQYDDGYKSWSPAKAFEEGYVRL